MCGRCGKPESTPCPVQACYSNSVIWHTIHLCTLVSVCPKKGNAKECSNYRTTALISHASKVMLKILQARLQQYVNCELPDVQAGFEKAEKPEIKLPTSAGSWKKQESSRKISISALLTMPKLLTVWITINCGRFWKRWEYQNLTCLLRNLYAGQEATVRTGHGNTDWFQIGKGVRQGCILSSCLFNFYAEYIMRNAGLEEHKLESRLPGEISITSDMQMTPPLWKKVKKT